MGNYDSYIEGKPTESNAKTIEIVFENKNINVSVGEAVGDYHSHPAFQAFDTNGLWVAKFETSGTKDNIEIKPNKISLRNLSIKDIFETSLVYKLNNKSHMMKNTEWGAISYLSHSKYGINKKININNNSNYITGYSASDSTDQTKYPGTYGIDPSITQPYNTETGHLASSTGNISGIYDNIEVDEKKINVVIPTFFYLDKNSKVLDKTTSTTATYSIYKEWVDQNKLEILPKFTNNVSVSDNLLSYSQRSGVINSLRKYLVQHNYIGINIEFSTIDDVNSFYRFILELVPRFKEVDLKVAVTLNDNLDKSRLENVVDYIIED
jgi:hypothetical protein